MMIETWFRSRQGKGNPVHWVAFFLGSAVIAPFVQAQAEYVNPEAASGSTEKSVAVGRRFMAVTANPHATKAAQGVLRRGGNALDAALTAQWVLNLVEPQSSGIGGGAFLLYWDAKAKKLSAWDGRESAPAKSDAHFAQRADGSLIGFEDMVSTGKSVGTPGLVAMLAAAHRRHGRLSWRQSFTPAIQLAERGFAVSPRLHKLLAEDKYLRSDPMAASLYYRPDGRPRSIAERLKNLALADSFRRLARGGPDAFYHGRLAEEMVRAVQQRGGWLSRQDLAHYQPQERDAVCSAYRHYQICGMPPPSSGGIAVAQLLGILERSGPPLADVMAVDSVHRFAEAGRLVFADRATYLADPGFVTVPSWLLDGDYLLARATLIDPAKSLGRAEAGLPPGSSTSMTPSFSQRGISPEVPATTHLSIVDAEGNAVAMTSSIEAGFGSRIMVGGFLLNNQLTDFSFAAERDGKHVANRLEPGKRPLSSMSPTVVFDEHKRLWAVLGSPGGSRIINYVAQTLVALIDAKLSPGIALSLPHVGSRNGPTELESVQGSEQLAKHLIQRGHTVRQDEMTSGTHLILRNETDRSWLGAADPRREGQAAGG